VLTGRDVNGPEGVIGPVDGFGLVVNTGLPAGVIGIRQDQIAGLLGFDGDGDGVEVVLEEGKGREGLRRGSGGAGEGGRRGSFF
jgi:hypothetical protein